METKWNMSMRNHVAVVAIARNEERYVEEWIKHYLGLGVERIFIFDNNDPGNNSMRETARKFGDRVVVLDLRGRQALVDIGYQVGAYRRAYEMIHDQYDWIGFFDIDEFLHMDQYPLDDFLDRGRFRDTSVIHFNWKYYGDNGLVFYDDRPVQERFAIPAADDVRYAQSFPENNHVKSLVRARGNTYKGFHEHTVFGDFVCRRPNGNVVNGNSPFMPYNFETAYVKHYGTKTIEEYIQRRCFNLACANASVKFSVKTRMDWFFNVNEHTVEKDTLARFAIDNY